jgi:hypothetical protein
LTGQAVDAMTRASEKLGTPPAPPAEAPTPDGADAGPLADQRLAARRLAALLDALKPDDKRQARGSGGSGAGDEGEGGGREGGGGRPAGDGIPAAAQLKLLRQMQAELVERTDRFAKDHPPKAELTDAARHELEEIRKAQADVASLVEELTAPAGPES